MITHTTSTLTYIDHMGDDRRIAEAAWVSISRGSNRTDEEDARVIRYLARNNHWTPFGQTSITIRFHVPIFVARQLLRSNVGIVWNEESRRYITNEPEFYIPKFRERSPSMKQGSGGPLGEALNQTIGTTYRDMTEQALIFYNLMLLQGVAPEQARTILPQNMFTSIMGTFSLAALARLYSLRSHPHAQQEIQEVAGSINQLMGEQPLGNAFAVSWPALTTGATLE